MGFVGLSASLMVVTVMAVVGFVTVHTTAAEEVDDSDSETRLDNRSRSFSILPRLDLSALRQRIRKWDWPQVQWDALDEIALVVVWAIWVGRAYLDLNSTAWPWGGEFPMSIQSHFVWTLLDRCGACVAWNGFINGGAPSFVELHGAPLHPLVVLTSLIWGVVAGAKITAVMSLVIAGIAQWWLARVLGLGVVPRLWSAALAVVGGHLAGRMEVGLIPLILSTATTSLVVPAGVNLALTGSRRASVLLGVVMALALVSGQGYLQLGMVFGLLPAFAVFWVDDKLQVRSLWREFVRAGILALVLAGIFLVPLLHFWPGMDKGIDPSLGSAQPLEYAPLNLVIRDIPFLRSELLQKHPYPYLYTNYISWVPVLLMLLAWRLVPRSELRLLAFFVVAIVFVYLAASAETFKALLGPVSPEFVNTIRNPAVIAGLAVPLILGLAAWGLDILLELDWPVLTLSVSSGRVVGVSVAWLVLALPLSWAVKSSYDLSRAWLRTTTEPAEVRPVVRAMETDSAQWVRPPFGEHFWMPAALDAGLKVTHTYRPWGWAGREFPPIHVEGTRDAIDQSSLNFMARIDDVSLIAHPENQYAYIDTGSEQVPCQAVAAGGNIDVDCETDVPGTLVVLENQWSGWQARRDGEAVSLNAGQWLSTDAPAGKHHYEFRYRPWDVPLGASLTFAGLLWAVWLWFHPGSASADGELDAGADVTDDEQTSEE